MNVVARNRESLDLWLFIVSFGAVSVALSCSNSTYMFCMLHHVVENCSFNPSYYTLKVFFPLVLHVLD